MGSKHAEPTGMTFTNVEVISFTIDLNTLAATLARQPRATLISLIEKIDAETGDWSFFDALDAWIKLKLSEEIEES